MDPELALFFIIVREEAVQSSVRRELVQLLQTEFVQRIINAENFFGVCFAAQTFQKFLWVNKAAVNLGQGLESYALFLIFRPEHLHVENVRFHAL